MPRLDAERVTLWRTFQIAAEVVSRSIEQEMADEFRLSLPQFDLLAVLAQNNDQLRVKELCEQLQAVPSSLSRRIDSLVERGFVTREAAPTIDDNRAVMVRLTRRAVCAGVTPTSSTDGPSSAISPVISRSPMSWPWLERSPRSRPSRSSPDCCPVEHRRFVGFGANTQQ